MWDDRAATVGQERERRNFSETCEPSRWSRRSEVPAEPLDAERREGSGRASAVEAELKSDRG